MKHNTTDKSNLRSAKPKIALTLASIFIACVVCLGVFCVSDGAFSFDNAKDPLTAYAADVSSGSAFINAINSNTAINLTKDITISGNYSESTYARQINGNGHTITISGSGSRSFGSQGSQTNHYVGLIAGVFKGTLQNVKINYTGSYSLLSSNANNPGDPDGKNLSTNANSTTIFGGIICGDAVGAVFTGVTLTVSGSFAVEGIDASSSYGSGNGGVAGGFAGRSGGATFTDCTLNLSGIIHAIGENNDAGAEERVGGSSWAPIYRWNDCSANTNACRASSGGMVGELYDGSTVFDGLTVSGKGAVGAYVYGQVASGRNQQYALKANFAGLLIGFVSESKASYAVNSMLYKFQGATYVNTRLHSGSLAAGLLVGETSNATLNANSLWRDVTDSSANAGIATYGISASGQVTTSVVSSILKAVSSKISNSGTIKTLAMGSGNITSATYNNLNEYEPYLTYVDKKSSAYGTFSIDAITSTSMTVSVKSNSPYMISALQYVSSGSERFDNVYDKQVTTYTFTSANPKVTYFAIYTVTTTYEMLTNYSAETSTQEYQGIAATFSGYPGQGVSVPSNMKWAAVNTSDDSKSNYSAAFGTNTVGVGPATGTYVVSLYKQGAGDSLVAVEKDEVLGVNTQNAPSKIYLHDPVRFSYTYTITKIEITLQQVESSTITKEYDATAVIDATMIDSSNFSAVRADNGGELPDTPTIMVGSGSFFAEYSSGNYVESASVGENKYAIIKNCYVPENGNYVLKGDSGTQYIFSNCSITPRTMGLNWSSLELSYNGKYQYPTATPANLLPGDENMEIVITYSVYDDAMMSSPLQSVNIGDYIVRAFVSSESGSANYKLPEDLTITSRTFTISPKEIGVVWSGTNLTYNTQDQTIEYSFATGAIENKDEGNISLNVLYYDEENIEYPKMREAGSYYAIATLSGVGSENYVLDETGRCDDITIAPMSIELAYYTGIDGTAVEDLVYMGADYAGHDDGLHVKVITPDSGLNEANLSLTFPAGVEVKKVGEYSATVNIVSDPSHPIDISNYRIAAGHDTCTVTIVKKPLDISFTSNYFTYNGYSQSPNYTVNTQLYPGDSAPISRQLYQVSSPDDVPITNAVNVGQYKLVLSIAECDYRIADGDEECTFDIATLSISTASSITVDAIGSFEYTSGPNEPAPTVRFNGNILNAGTDYTVSYSNNVEVSTQAVIKIEGTGNFSGTREQHFTITKKTLTLNFLSESSFTYNGIAREINAELSGYYEETAPTIKITYYRNGIQTTEAVTVGNYTATATFAETQKNYSLPAATSFDFEITKATVSVKISYADPADDLVYDAEPHLVTVDWADGITIPEIDSSPEALDFNVNYYGSGGNLVADGPVNVGNYSVTITLKGTARDNYTLASSSQTYSVTERPVRISFDEAENSLFVYTASLQSAIYAYTDETADIIPGYDPLLSVTYTRSGMPAQPINAGTYTVHISAQNPNYKAVTESGDGQTPGGLMRIAAAELRPNVTASGKIYDGTAVVANYSYTEGFGMLGQDNISLDVRYYIIDNGSEVPVSSCISAGSYIARLALPETNSNYFFNEEVSILECNFEIAKREIAYQFDNAGTRTYDGSYLVVTAGLAGNNGKVPDVNFSGIIASDNAYEFIVTMYDSDSNEVEYIRNVGEYTAEITFVSANYRLTDNQSYSTVAKIEIEKKAVTFTPKDIHKIFGTSDNPSDFLQTLTYAELGVEGDEVTVELKRVAGEKYGTYVYTDIVVPADSNYEITSTGGGAFYIDKRSFTLTPLTFTMEYLGTAPLLEQKEVIQTDALGAVEITIAYTRLTTETGVGTYDLSPVFEVRGTYADSFAVSLVADGNKGKFVITGRSVTVTLDESMLTVVYDPMRKSDPDFIDAIVSVEVDRCADDIQSAYDAYLDAHGGSAEGFPWENYIRITRNDGNNFGYKEGGYTVTINFLKNGMIDNNYRAITPSGDSYVYMIEKLDLTGKLTEPTVINVKNYDGTTTATISSNATGIPSEYSNQGVRAYANFSDKNAGTDKTITVSYAFSIALYENNYILPASFEYSQKGEITPLALTTEITLTAPEIVYGNVPEITVSLSGFISGENAATEGISLVPVYEDGTAIDVIRDVSANYRIVLQLLSYAGTNYTVNYSSVACNIRILPKTVTVVAGEPYEKPVDGTFDTSGFGTDNYVIEGLFAGDVGYVYIEYVALLNSAEPGNATVNVRINGLIGEKKDNYTLANDTFTVPATILKLADVTMTDASYPYDTEAKQVIPVLTDVLDGVTYSVEYSGRGGTVYEASEYAPVNAGEYLVRCYLELNKYKRFAAECYLTIEKITPTIYFDGVFTQTYGTFTPITATATAAGLNETLNVEYSFVDPGESMPQFAPAGNHAVTARFDSTVNYYATSKETSLVIKQKAVTVSFSGYTGLVYNGLDRSLTDEIQVTFNGVVEGDVCEPVKTFSPETVKNAGTYFLEVRPGNPNYKTTGSISITFTIAKKTLVVSATAEDVVAGTQPTFNITYEGFIDNDDESDLTVAPTVNMTAGQVGANRIEFNNGIDENYSFVYKESTYNITYTPKQEQSEERTITVTTIVILSVVGAIAVIILLGFLVKTLTYRSMYNVSSVKRDVRERMRREQNSDRDTPRKKR